MKKIGSFLLTLVLCASISTVFGYAFDIPNNSKSCEIYKNEAYSYSDFVVGTWKYYGAQCYTGSKDMVVEAQYFDGSSNKYIADQKETLVAYSNFMDHKTREYNGPLCWRVYLESSGIIKKDAYGRAYIRNIVHV